MFIEKIFFKIVIPVIAFIFILIHAFYEKHINIDEITLWLLVIILVPFLSKHLDSLKVGDLELKFKSLKKTDQIFVFLKSIAQDAIPTFYKPRPNESELGIVGKHLVLELIQTNPIKLNEEINTWLTSNETGLRWLASEIIGFFKMRNFISKLTSHYDCKQIDSDWENWKLNYLWAHSKLDNDYQELNDFLFNTMSEHNQIWLLDVYIQMVEADKKLQPLFLEKAEELSEKGNLSQQTKDNKLPIIIKTLKKLKK